MVSVLATLPLEDYLRQEPCDFRKDKEVCNIWVLLPLTFSIGFFLSLMAVERPHFHSILLLILSVKTLFTKDSLMRYLTGSWEAKVLRSWLFSEFNCVTLGKSLNLSVLQSPYLVKWE